MAIDEMIEQLAFGRSIPKISSCIGLSISTDALFISGIRERGGKPEVEHLLRIPVVSSGPGKDTLTRVAGALNTELLADTEKIAGLVKPAIAQTKLGSQNLVVSISHHFGLLRYFTMPAIDKKFWKTAIPAEAKKYIPIPFGDLVHEFQVFPLPPGPDHRPKLGVLFGVIHRKNLENIRVIAEKLGFNLLGVELAPCSVERLWDSLEPPTPASSYCQVQFDGGWVRILLSENGAPVFFREILLPEDGVVLDLRKVDLSGCVDFCKKQLGSKNPSKVSVSGSNASLSAWKEAFAQEMSLPVQFNDIPKALGIKAGEWGAYAALGAGLRYLIPTAIKLELSQSRKISDEEKRAVTTLFTLTAALSALLLASGLGRSAIASYKSTELSRLSYKNATISAFKGKTAQQINKMIQEMEDKANSFASMSSSKMDFTKILEVIAEDAPEPLWLSAITYSSPIGETGGGQRTLRTLKLEGHVMAESAGTEQDIAIQFKTKLQADPRFSRMFTCSSPQIVQSGSSTASSPLDNGAANPAALSRSRETRTTFTVDCAAKRS